MRLHAQRDPEPESIVSVSGPVHLQTTTWSYWLPTWRDILRLIMGRPIRLGVFGAKSVFIDTEE